MGFFDSLKSKVGDAIYPTANEHIYPRDGGAWWKCILCQSRYETEAEAVSHACEHKRSYEIAKRKQIREGWF